MAGHSKWANIRHKKGAADAKRGKLFTKIAKEITVAAKMGGGDEESNPRLRRAILSARAVSMPKDNISRAIKRGTGELDGVSYEEFQLEGYGPGGVAFICDCLTDNRNRTLHEVRFAFNKGNGNMGEKGSVSWMFHDKGVLVFDLKKNSLEELQEIAIDAGAEDFEEADETLTVYTSKEDFDSVKESFDAKNIESLRQEMAKIPENTIAVSGEDAEGVIKLFGLLEDCDDVQNVSANFDISDEELERITGDA